MRKKYKSDPSDLSDKSDGRNPYGFRTADAETFANTLICLINQASFLIGRQIRRLEQSFITEGGFSEKLYRVRSQARRGQ